jgi:hypothetical protein
MNYSDGDNHVRITKMRQVHQKKEKNSTADTATLRELIAPTLSASDICWHAVGIRNKCRNMTPNFAIQAAENKTLPNSE